MESQYTDRNGILQDIEIFESDLNGKTVYTIHRNGYYFVDLVQDEGVWTELYGGKTERSEEYGLIIAKLFAYEK